jgi:hypothetical protein
MFRPSRRNQVAAATASRPVACGLLRREGGDDFFEPRVAAKGIPERHQFQFAIAEVEAASGTTDGSGKLFAGEIFRTIPWSPQHFQAFALKPDGVWRG